MEKLEKLAAETKFSVYSRRVTLVVTGVATILIICVLSLFAAVIVLKLHTCSDGLDPSSPEALKDAKKVICLEPGCLAAAERAVESMNPSVDPCEDFYEYACGGWVQNNGIPPDKTSISESGKLQTDSYDKIRKFLEKRSTWHVSPVGRKLKKFFRLCLHDFGRSKDGGQQLVSILRDGLKSWLLNNETSWVQDFNMADMVEKAHAEYKVPVLYNYDVWPDFRNTKKSIISILPGSIGMRYRDFVSANNKTRELYKNYMNQTVQLLLRDAGLTDTVTAEQLNSKLRQFMDDAYAMEKQVAYAIMTTDTSWRYFGQFTTVGDLHINFTELQLAPVLMKAFRHSGVTSATDVLIRHPNFMNNLNTHLQNLTNGLTQAVKDRYYSNYLTWSTLRLYSRWMSWEYRNLRYGFFEAKSGRSSYSTTWYSCLALMRSYFTLGLGGIFVNQHLNKENKPKVNEMFENFKTKLQDRIDGLGWMDEEDRAEAKIKALETVCLVGFPDILSDQTELEDMYSHFNFSYNKGLMWNLLQANHFYDYVLNHELQQGREYTVWRYELQNYGYGARPSFWWIHNNLLVPPGTLREPMFGTHSPDVVNYGKLGVYMASRMFHVLDVYGRWTYNHTFSFWWNENTMSNYTVAADCMVNFYSNQTLGPYLVGGQNKTVQADPRSRMWRILSNTGGLSIAYKAYKDLDGSHKRDIPMPRGKGYELNSDQLFFLSAAQMRCYKQRDRTAYNRAIRKSLPDNSMINGMMSQTPEFVKVFKCSPQSKMYPKQTCKVF